MTIATQMGELDKLVTLLREPPALTMARASSSALPAPRKPGESKKGQLALTLDRGKRFQAQLQGASAGWTSAHAAQQGRMRPSSAPRIKM